MFKITTQYLLSMVNVKKTEHYSLEQIKQLAFRKYNPSASQKIKQKIGDSEKIITSFFDFFCRTQEHLRLTNPKEFEKNNEIFRRELWSLEKYLKLNLKLNPKNEFGKKAKNWEKDSEKENLEYDKTILLLSKKLSYQKIFEQISDKALSLFDKKENKEKFNIVENVEIENNWKNHKNILAFLEKEGLIERNKKGNKLSLTHKGFVVGKIIICNKRHKTNVRTQDFILTDV
jgi:predicted transcriptional regulator